MDSAPGGCRRERRFATGLPNSSGVDRAPVDLWLKHASGCHRVLEVYHLGESRRDRARAGKRLTPTRMPVTPTLPQPARFRKSRRFIACRVALWARSLLDIAPSF